MIGDKGRDYVVVAEKDTRPYNIVHFLELQNDVPSDPGGFAGQFCRARFRATSQLEGQYPGHSVFHYSPVHESDNLAADTTVNGLRVTEQCKMETKKASEFL